MLNGNGGRKQSATVECPKVMIGRVIGKNGNTIKSLQSYSGALIQIDQTCDPTKVTISGSTQSLNLALSMVQDIIQGTFKGFALLRQTSMPASAQQQPFPSPVSQSRPIYAPGYGLIPPSQLYGVEQPFLLPTGPYARPMQRPMAYPSQIPSSQVIMTQGPLMNMNQGVPPAQLPTMSQSMYPGHNVAPFGSPDMNYYSPPSTDFIPNPSLIGGDPSRLGTGARLLSAASGVRRQGDRQSHIPPGSKGMGGAEMMSMGPGQMTNVSMVPGSMPSQRTPALVDEGSGMHLNGNMQPLFMHSDGQFFGYSA